jgi:hypothetical protein
MLLLALVWSCTALTLRDVSAANPIRKVVKLLQDMQKEIEVEGEKEQDLFDKFMCYCDGNTGEMEKATKDASERITQLKSKLESDKAEKIRVDSELIGHKKDRESANQDLQKANSIREKEHKEYVEAVGEQKENLEAMTNAITALEEGMGKSLLQANTKARKQLMAIVRSAADIDDVERSTVLSFVDATQSEGYNPASGEIVGILKQMKDDMDKSLGGAVKAEDAAQEGFSELAAAKKSEIEAATAAIEAKTQRGGALAVAIATAADDIEDTTKELSDNQAFLANLASSCAQKREEWDERKKTRASEVAGISEAIKILNDDDALDLFKKTLAFNQNTASLLQGENPVRRAKELLAAAVAAEPNRLNLVFIRQALSQKAVDFSKVIQMIDDMASALTAEQADDDSQKAFCEKDLDAQAHKEDDLQTKVETSTALIEDSKEAAEQFATEVEELKTEIELLDASVKQSTAQRQAEHEEFLTFSSEQNAALQLIEKAKNRLYKFYRPEQYKEPTAAPAFIQVLAPDAPETWDGEYAPKTGKSNGVLAMMDNLVKQLEGELKEAQHDEATGQSNYESLMARSQASRAKNVESITHKEAAKADLDTKIQRVLEQKASQEAELQGVKEYITNLHASCDFLLQNYDLRQAARATETESLKNAKAVLSGADFS